MFKGVLLSVCQEVLIILAWDKSLGECVKAACVLVAQGERKKKGGGVRLFAHVYVIHNLK